MNTHKLGANFTDVRLIKKHAAAGNSAEDISAELRIVLSCVESYMPKAEEKPKRKRRSKEEMEADALAAEQTED
jgi:hypothetical protein